MKFLSLTKVWLIFLVSVLLVVAFSFTIMLMHAYRECENFKNRERACEERLVRMREEVESKDKYLNLILHEPEFFVRVVRQKLGYVRPDEVIFRFEEKTIP